MQIFYWKKLFVIMIPLIIVQDASYSDVWTTLTDSFRCGGVAALLSGPPKWPHFSLYLCERVQAPFGGCSSLQLVSAISFFGHYSELAVVDQSINQQVCSLVTTTDDYSVWITADTPNLPVDFPVHSPLSHIYSSVMLSNITWKHFQQFHVRQNETVGNYNR